MNQEFQETIDPIEHTAKFAQIQEADERLNTLYGTNQDADRKLWEFKPTMQETNVKMKQLDSIAEYEW